MSYNMSVESDDQNFHQSSVTQQFLRQISFFNDLSEESLMLFDKRVHKKSFKKGEQIISEFEPATSVFFVNSGIVKLTKQDINGKEMIVCIRREGEIFAAACLFGDGNSNYPATGTMLKDGEVFYLSMEDLEQELLMTPELAVVMMRHMGKSLNYMTSMIRDIALMDVYTKTIRTIGRLVEQFDLNKCQQKDIEIPLTVQEFANVVGASRESVSRVFSILRKEGVLEIKGRQIIIPEWCEFCSSYLQGSQI